MAIPAMLRQAKTMAAAARTLSMRKMKLKAPMSIPQKVISANSSAAVQVSATGADMVRL